MPENTFDTPDPQSHPEAPVNADIVSIQAELDEARSRALRLMADFQNYQRRAHQNEAQARREGVAAAVAAVVPVLDHFDNALCMDSSAGSAEQVMQGVRVIREEMLKALGQLGVTLISPRANDDFEPGKHEAVMQRPSEGVEPGRIVQTFQAGYQLGPERILRPAKVVVAPTGG
ncbi:MAG: nucleotide exchange factor GrpE [Leptolyngbya sp. PLA1]|nr:nucleotide exchange factor GrpE [Leptolyngbya sp. PLA1]